MIMLPHHTPNRILMETALGNRPADLVIRDGTLVDVYSGRLIPGRSVAVVDKWIAYVGPDAGHTIGKATRVIDAAGRIISPGYMDTHTHIDSFWNIADFLHYAIPSGATTIVTELSNFGCAMGAEGMKGFLEQMRNRPIKFYGLIPPLVTFSPALISHYLSPEKKKFEELLKDEMVLGLGESYWQRVVLNNDETVFEIMQQAIRAGKTVQGHGAGAFDRKLAAYACAGVLSCHESITSEDVLSRLELGYYAMVREGEVRSDLETLRPLKDKIDFRRVILVSDGVAPGLVINHGYLVDTLQKAVDMGLGFVNTIRMVSINPAEHFGLDHITGGVAPNRFADILVLPEEGKMRPDLVISEGKIIAENGRTIVNIPRVPYPAHFLHSLKMAPVSPSELAVPVSAATSGEVRTIDIQNGGLVTREGKAKPRRVGEHLEAAPEEDLLKVVFMERITEKGEKFVGFIRGWGLRKGAVASTLCWEASGIVAIGTNDLDLATVINKIIEMQGGAAVSVDGEVRIGIPASVLGFLSELPIADVGAGFERFKSEVNGLGVKYENPHLTLVVLTTPAIPFIRISEKGYYRFREDDYVGI